MSSIDIDYIDCLLEDLGRAREQLRLAELKLIKNTLREDYSICVEKVSSETRVLKLSFTNGDDSFSTETVYVDTEELMEVAGDESLSDRISTKE